jgi:hypothetical protein
MFVAQALQTCVDLTAPAAFRDDSLELVFGSRSYPHAHAVVGKDLELLDVFHGLPGHDRVRATGVVADHSAQGATAVRRRIRTERESMSLSGIAQASQTTPGLTIAVRPCGSIVTILLR